MKRIIIKIAFGAFLIWILPIWVSMIFATMYFGYKFKGIVNKWRFRKVIESGVDGEIFPWKDVGNCLNRPTFQGGTKRCPKCGRPAYRLVWIFFTSPPKTWEELCGRCGQLSLCPKCKKQVEFLCSVMN